MISPNNVISFVNFVLQRCNFPPLTHSQAAQFYDVDPKSLNAELERYFGRLGIDSGKLAQYKALFLQPIIPDQHNLNLIAEQRTNGQDLNAKPRHEFAENAPSSSKNNNMGWIMGIAGIAIVVIAALLIYFTRRNDETINLPSQNNTNVNSIPTVITPSTSLPFVGEKSFYDYAYATTYIIKISESGHCEIIHTMRDASDIIYSGNFSKQMKTEMGYINIEAGKVYLCDENGAIRQDCMPINSADECSCEFSIDTEELVEPDNNITTNSSLLYPQTSERILSRTELANYTAWELRIMRNEIFAKYGYIFKSEDLKNYFNQQLWYRPRYSDVSDRLTPIEKKNTETIKSME